MAMLNQGAKSSFRFCSWLTSGRGRLSAAYAVVVTLFAIAHASIEPYDDAHFFKRIAVNGLDRGSFAWNLDEGPVYGATSQSYQAVAVGLTALTRTHYMLATRLFSIACLVAAFAILVRLTARFDKGSSATFAFCSAVLLFPTITGMETALAVLSVTLLVWGAARERTWWGTRPLLLLFVYLTRPDAAALGAPLLIDRWFRAGRRAWVEILLSVAVLATALLLFKLYYGTALPLPFYAKQKAFSPYDEHFLRLSAEVGAQRFALFALSGAPLLLRALFLRDRTNGVLVGAAATFVGFHLWSTVDVMGMQGRFYAPSLPLLVLASARAGGAGCRVELRSTASAAAGVLALYAFLTLSDGLPSGKDFRLDLFPRFLQLSTVVGGAALVLALGRRTWHGVLAAGPLALVAVGSVASVSSSDLVARNDDDFLDLQTSRYTVYRGLDTLRACFGEGIHVYHSEIGLPGLRFQGGKVTDLVGLMSPEWLSREHVFDELCQRDRPEGIFLPHRNYAGLNAEIRASECLRGYRRVVPESSSPLYVRSDLASRYLECAKERQDEFVVGAGR
jgi:hypothetical protein